MEEWVDGVEYNTKVAKFINVSSLTLYFPNNFGEVRTHRTSDDLHIPVELKVHPSHWHGITMQELTKVYYIGFKGEFTSYKRQVVEAVYEARPIPKDHKVGDEISAGSMPGF